MFCQSTRAAIDEYRTEDDEGHQVLIDASFGVNGAKAEYMIYHKVRDYPLDYRPTVYHKFDSWTFPTPEQAYDKFKEMCKLYKVKP